MAPPLRWGLTDTVPDGAPAAWGCRAIDHEGRLDIVWDRVDCTGPDDLRARLRTLMADRVPPAELEARCARLDLHATHPAVVYTDGDIEVAARRRGGYIYVAAWLHPQQETVRYAFLKVRALGVIDGDGLRHPVDRYHDTTGHGIWFDDTRIGVADILWVDTPPEGAVRTRYLRCQRCGDWLAGREARWADGYVYGADCCWDERLSGVCEGHPDDVDADDPEGDEP